MSKQTINLGTTPSDGTGDSIRAAFGKTNSNFDELYAALPGKADASALSTETTARANADATLQGHINDEAAARAAADALKADASALTAEASTRAAADTTLQNNINAEATARAAADALKADLVGGKVPTSQIPAIAISSYLGSVASQTAMLALDGQSGDWCNRSDTSTAWVITGIDPTQLSSWAQINYPVAPVTSVNGQTGVIVLGKSDVGLGSVDNTADSAKPVSTAQQTALNLKQNAATLGADAAAAVHAASSKTTPADADELPLADSAAMFGLKKLTWAGLKTAVNAAIGTLTTIQAASLKTPPVDGDGFVILDSVGSVLKKVTGTGLKAYLKSYFDGLYNLYVLPPPGVGTLGGVKRNTGSAGQFVSGVASDGALIFGTPAGGGGAPIVAGSASLTGNAVPSSPATSPAGYVDFSGLGIVSPCTVTMNNGDQPVTITFDFADPSDGTVWVDISGFTSPADMANALNSVIGGGYGTYQVNNISGARIDLSAPNITGASAALLITSNNGLVATTGTTYGNDAVPGYGATTLIEIIPYAAGKSTLPLRCAWSVVGGMAGVQLIFALRRFSTGELLQLGNAVALGTYPNGELGNSNGSFGLIADYYTRWTNAQSETSLLAYYNESAPDGGSVTVWAQAAQQ